MYVFTSLSPCTPQSYPYSRASPASSDLSSPAFWRVERVPRAVVARGQLSVFDPIHSLTNSWYDVFMFA